MTDPLQLLLDANDIDEDPGDVAGELVDSTNDAIERLGEVSGAAPGVGDEILVSKNLNGRPGFNTIQGALNGSDPQNGASGAEAGDTIVVEDGEFNEIVSVTKPNITLVGGGEQQTTIAGQINAAAPGFTLQETTVRADLGVTEDTAVLIDDGTDAVVRNNTIVARENGFGMKINQAPSSGTAGIETNTFQPFGNETVESLLVIGPMAMTDGGEQMSLGSQTQSQVSDQSSVQVTENQFVGNVGGDGALLVDVETETQISVENNDFSETLLFDGDAELISNQSEPLATVTTSGNAEPAPLSQGEGIDIPGDGDVQTADLTGDSELPGLTAQDIAASLVPERDTPQEEDAEGFFMSAYVPTVVDEDGIPVDIGPRGTTAGTTADENAAIAIPESRDSNVSNSDLFIPGDFDADYFVTIPVTIVWNSTLTSEEFGRIAVEIAADTGGRAIEGGKSVAIEQPQGEEELEIEIAYSFITGGSANFRDGGSLELTVDFDAFDTVESDKSELPELADTNSLSSTVEYATPNNSVLAVTDLIGQSETAYEEGMELAEEVTKLPEGSVDILRDSARLALYADIATDDRELAEDEFVQGATIDGLSAFADQAESINAFNDSEVFKSDDRVTPAGPAVGFATDPESDADPEEIQVTNASFIGDNRSGGVFEFNPPDSLPSSIDSVASAFIGNGAILSTGKIDDIEGPNESSSTSTVTDGGPDDDLEALPTIDGDTDDTAALEFDLEVPPDVSAVSFRYVFGSEEYNEFTGSSFNDVFAFFVNGENVATVPDPDDPSDQIPASINNVNHGREGVTQATNPQLFINNDPYDGDQVTVDPQDPPGPGIGFDPGSAGQGDEPFPFEMDGFTIPLKITAPVNPGESNSVKIAIADVSDALYDSWVVAAAADITSVN